jgi:antitoxin ParD1/3/4
MPNVHLTKQMQDFADRKIASGEYSKLSEVVRAGMRLLMNRDRALPIIWVRMAELEEAALDGRLGDDA